MARSDPDTAAEVGSSTTPPSPRRINVAITPDMLAAIDRLIDREGVTLTEAVRRLIGYGDVVYRSVKEEGQTLLLRGEGGKEREILLI